MKKLFISILILFSTVIKFNSLYLLVFDTEAFNNAGGLSGFDFEQIINDNSITEVFSGWSNQISDNSVIDGEHIYYRISDVTASTVKMEFEKIVFSFNDGTADKTVTF